MGTRVPRKQGGPLSRCGLVEPVPLVGGHNLNVSHIRDRRKPHGARLPRLRYRPEQNKASNLFVTQGDYWVHAGSPLPDSRPERPRKLGRDGDERMPSRACGWSNVFSRVESAGPAVVPSLNCRCFEWLLMRLALLVALSLEIGANAQPPHLYRDPRDSYHFTGEVEANGADPTPEGKFRKLTVRVGVDTPGGQCSWSGSLKEEGGRDVDFKNGYPTAGPLASGKSFLTLEFDGFTVARRKHDGPLMVTDLTLTCSSGMQVGDHEKHRTASFRSTDFDNPEPDFELVAKQPSVRVAPGDSVFPSWNCETSAVWSWTNT
jgi:hypothetical protein